MKWRAGLEKGNVYAEMTSIKDELQISVWAARGSLLCESQTLPFPAFAVVLLRQWESSDLHVNTVHF